MLMLNRFHDMSAHFCVKNIPDTHHYQALNFDVFFKSSGESYVKARSLKPC